ncbi:hypothetical protein CIB43_00247 [Mesomycoplasma hyopneumoniae]|uniref:Uncharacterized protein n=1 Tax=Mesomycoplasma hyopneumoniae TaxID=2099 RepID=A0A223M9B6_MESHO|nr:hypothetical protein CIB43_00247 [Mesomycoplasma hyopneumoniae]
MSLWTSSLKKLEVYNQKKVSVYAKKTVKIPKTREFYWFFVARKNAENKKNIDKKVSSICVEEIKMENSLKK